MGTNRIDYNSFEGQVFVNLIFLKALPTVNNRRRPIEVGCICGNVTIVDWDNLRSGKTKSCGCKQHREKWEGSDH